MADNSFRQLQERLREQEKQQFESAVSGIKGGPALPPNKDRATDQRNRGGPLGGGPPPDAQ